MSDVEDENKDVQGDDGVNDGVNDDGVNDDSKGSENYLERIVALETDNEKLKAELESLKARVECLEAGEDDQENESKTPKKQKSKKKTKEIKKSTGKKETKKKGTGKKEELSAPKNEKSEGKRKFRDSIRDRAKTDFYHFCGNKMFISVPEPFKSGSKKQGPPQRDLLLNYAYGYNGSINHNLLSLDDEIVYGLAGVVVVYKPAENTQKFFTGHSEDVSCISKHPEKKLIASGQRDPKDGLGEEDRPYVCIWDAATMEEAYRISNYCERFVSSVGFTFDGKYIYVISGDDNHTGGLFDFENDCKKPVIESMTSKDKVFGQAHALGKLSGRYNWVTFGLKVLKWFSFDPDEEDVDNKLKSIVPSVYQETKISQKSYYCATFTSDGDLLVGCHSGHIYVFASGSKKLIKFWDTGKSPIKHITINDELSNTPDGTAYRALTSNGVGYYYSKDHAEIQKISFKEKKISAACDVKETTYIGSKNNNLVFANFSESNEIKTLLHGHTKEIWCLATHPTNSWVCIGGDDKILRVWNWEDKTIVFSKKKLKHGYRCADFSRDGKYLAVGCLDGYFFILDTSDPDGPLVYEKHLSKEQISCVAFSSSGKKIVLGSWDQNVRIINVAKKFKVKVLKGHSSSITHIDMSVDGSLIQSDSKDCEKLYWDVKSGKRIFEIPADTIWDAWNCCFGWPVQGLFHTAGTVDDVNCCEISGGNELDDEKGLKVVASGNDTGHVTLFKYPILEEKPKYKQYLAHSAHVTNVTFSDDDQWLFSSGGGDAAVFQWKVVAS